MGSNEWWKGVWIGRTSASAPVSFAVKCDRCDNEATVHEVMIKSGKRHERHLCEGCAKASGLAIQTHAPITQLLTQYITSQVQPGAGGAAGQAAAAAPAAINTCPTCGQTQQQFRQTGLLGCPHCYAAFEAQLGALMARAHDGGTHHVGKRPARLGKGPMPMRAVQPPAAPVAGGSAKARPGTAAGLSARIQAMRQQLADAVAAEQYERAASLRDELKRLEAMETSPTPKATKKLPRKGPQEGEA